ncbi:MAG: efflux RND transporter periplasmic adaptor subunit [Flavitalea sp.]
MLKNNILFSLFLIVSALAISCKEEKKETPAAGAGPRVNAPIQVEGFIVKTKSLSEKIEVPGTLMPFETTEIRPEISGRLVSLNIPEGRFVNKGTVLAKIFDGDLQAQLRKLQVQLSIAEKTAERYNELLKISGISQQEYDLAELQSNNLRADIQLVQVDINRTQVRAPYSGQVGLKNISLGAYVSPTTLITTISQVNRLKLEFTVPEKYSEDMKPGKSISFSVTGSTKQFTAAVMATETTIEANTRSLRVRAVVNQNDAVLASGAFAKVSLNLDKNNEAIIIPTQAVIPQARNKRVIMYKNGSPEFIVVTTGIRDSTFVEITDGLKAGDTVVITGLLAIRPESKITLSKVQ